MKQYRRGPVGLWSFSVLTNLPLVAPSKWTKDTPRLFSVAGSVGVRGGTLHSGGVGVTPTLSVGAGRTLFGSKVLRD